VIRQGRESATPRHGERVPPLAGTLKRVSEIETAGYPIGLTARLGLPDEPGWTAASDLYRDRLGGVLDRAGGDLGPGNRAYTGTSVLRDCLWRLLTPAVAAVLTERRLPDLIAANVGLRFGEGGFTEGLAFVGPRFYCLQEDPEAGHPDAVVLGSTDHLIDEARVALSETHVAALVPALRERGVRRGTRALERAAADVCAEAFIFVGRGLGREAEGVEGAGRLLGGASRISAPVNYRVLEYPGGSEATRVRSTCCLYYKTGNGVCFTCPHKTDEERVRQLMGESPEGGA
jgi:hypothetical protein